MWLALFLCGHQMAQIWDIAISYNLCFTRDVACPQFWFLYFGFSFQKSPVYQVCWSWTELAGGRRSKPNIDSPNRFTNILIVFRPMERTWELTLTQACQVSLWKPPSCSVHRPRRAQLAQPTEKWLQEPPIYHNLAGFFSTFIYLLSLFILFFSMGEFIICGLAGSHSFTLVILCRGGRVSLGLDVMFYSFTSWKVPRRNSTRWPYSQIYLFWCLFAVMMVWTGYGGCMSPLT